MSRTFVFSIAPRLLLLVLLATALWNPSIELDPTAVDLIVLSDESLSIDPTSRHAAWNKLARAAAELGTDSRLALIRFATTPVIEQPLQAVDADRLAELAIPKHPLDPSASDPAAALVSALRLIETDRATHIVIISDLIQTHGDLESELHSARNAGLDIHALSLAANDLSGDLRIDTLQAPARAKPGQWIPVTVSLHSPHDTTATLIVALDDQPRRESQITLSAGKRHTVEYNLPAPDVGPVPVHARLVTGNDPEPRNNVAETIVNIDGPGSTWYLGHTPEQSAFAATLANANPRVTRLSPGQFSEALENMSTPDLIVLDDIAATDLTEPAWRFLTQTVRRDGSGLMVLGGPNSYGAGGYRHSPLEDLLPVTAQSARPQPPASIVFLIDTSGSMDQPTGSSRLARARQAVEATMDALLDEDLVAILAFDIEPRLLAAMAPAASQRESLAPVWSGTASGGTRLAPALRGAIELLEETTTEQKIIVLVTDGFVGQEDLAGPRNRIATAGIDVLALAIGPDADNEVLGQLVAINNGHLLRVGDVTELPRLMRQDIEQRRSPARHGQFNPLTIRPLAFLDEQPDTWPMITGYMLARERSRATVYLESDDGDPLLAIWHAGAGRVVALPAGLGNWAKTWLDDPGHASYLAGLAAWTGRRGTGSPLDLSVDQQPGRLQFQLDLSPQLEPASSVELNLTAPNGQASSIDLEKTAPGRFVATVAVTLPGRYRALIRADGQRLQHELIYANRREYHHSQADREQRRNWYDTGLIKPWPDSGLPEPGKRDTESVRIRPWLLAMALAIFILLVIAERRPDMLPGRGSNN